MTKVIHQRDKCIGCGTCVAVCPAFWHMGDDGKASLKDAKDVGEGRFECECEDCGCCKEAAASCPVQIITAE
ncbi:MAG TPA: ferredoxin [Candidatus Paceibacterota bacterium]|nr:ferredoxin [Candidatus Paceibacterota bacterium]